MKFNKKTITLTEVQIGLSAQYSGQYWGSVELGLGALGLIAQSRGAKFIPVEDILRWDDKTSQDICSATLGDIHKALNFKNVLHMLQEEENYPNIIVNRLKRLGKQ